MATLIEMPKLGLTMVEGTITTWFKKEGDVVDKGERLFEVSTDKMTNEVESVASGVLRKIIVNEGETTGILTNVAIIAEKDEDISAYVDQDVEETVVAIDRTEEKSTVKMDTSVKGTGVVKASPLAKKIAGEKGLDLSVVTGTGPNGRIIEKDILAFIANNSLEVKASPMAAIVADELNVDLKDIRKDSRIMKADVYQYARGQKSLSSFEATEERIPMTQMRKIIAKRMHQSWSEAPAVTYDLRADVSNLMALKDQLATEEKITYTDLIVKVVAKALLEFPYLNSSIDGDNIILKNYANIGVAVAVEDGLVVPVVKFANAKGLSQISNEIKELAEKARNNALTEEEYIGGTFTITNLGMFGMESFTPIINPPEVAILGVNTIIETPIVENGDLVIKPMMNLSLTADHRVVDGSVGAGFLARVKEYIEKPGKLLL